MKEIQIKESVMQKNDHLANQISTFLREKKILCVNLQGSPGAGKTTFIEYISKYIDPKKIAVIQGDLESDVDQKRLHNGGIYTHQINTHSGCHLNSTMINGALLEMNLSNKEYLIIENVGNLVCPAGIDIGQHMNMVVSSTTEGSDKPKKYPIIFMDAKLVLISKYDLASAVDFVESEYFKDILGINGKVKIIKTSKKNGMGFEYVTEFLKNEREKLIKNGYNNE